MYSNDIRNTQLAKTIINYSLSVQPGERVLIECRGLPLDLITNLIREIYAVGGLPFTNLRNPFIDRTIIAGCTKDQLELMYEFEEKRLNEMDCYIGIRMLDNSFEESEIPIEQTDLYNRIFERKLLVEIRVPKTRWVALRYPTPAMAQAAGMATEAFREYYYRACNINYEKMSSAMDSLVKLMNTTDTVSIISPGTNITFSIKNMGAVKCDGKANIPDGEVYTAPVKSSVQGVIAYNIPSIYDGFKFENIRLEFKDGKIISASSNNDSLLNFILNTDEGARYIGEFAIGVNPYIDRHIDDILFDEKITGSLHFTPGHPAMGTDNGNISQIHWDLILVQTAEHGGGEICFDGKLIRKDGLFVTPELESLNPEELRK
ncbi:MAG: aminopeptidase [Saccharofermentanales bacterium]|jgi:aminopeptidase